ncbi:hypothetical protein [Peribacillus muralis]|uniref:hypothetical protein n=1 Tax=Peribacillus muralis TaxID=264697 RepID=UPI00128FBE34|nr:hypothetical protein [Peribacillus muralis]
MSTVFLTFHSTLRVTLHERKNDMTIGGIELDRSFPLQALPYPEAVLEPPRLLACGVSSRHAFPAGVSHLPFHSTLREHEDGVSFAYLQFSEF